MEPNEVKSFNTKRIQSVRRNLKTISAITLVMVVMIGVVTVLSVNTGKKDQSGTHAAAIASRDKQAWPFSKYSVWNMPIGSNAQFSTGAGPHYAANGIYPDRLYFVPTTNNDPIVNLITPAGWGPGQRCSGTSVNGTIRVPNSFLLPDNSLENNHVVFIKPDGHGINQTDGTARCTAGGSLYGYSYGGSNFSSDLYGNGQLGTHAAQMSAYGGAIKQGELTSSTPIMHALAIELDNSRDLYYGGGGVSGCYRWPASGCDQFYYQPGYYGGTNPDLKMGALLSFPRGTTAASLGVTSAAGIKAFNALYNYGAYQTDTSNGSANWSANNIEIDNRAIGDYTTPFRTDLQKMIPALRVVKNNGPTSVGGGGNPVACYAPPFNDGTADSIATNPNGNVTEPQGCATGTTPPPPTPTPTPTPTPAPAAAQVSQTNNLAAGKTFTATIASVGAPYTIAAMTDKNETTRFISTASDPEAMTLDLGSAYTLSKVSILWAGDTTNTYDLQVSLDNSTWITVASGTTNNTPSQLIDTTSFNSAANGRYFRIVGKTRHNNTYGHSIWEVGLYGAPYAAPTPAPAAPPPAQILIAGNLAAAKTVTTSSVISNSPVYTGAKTVDGDETADTSRWISAVSDPQSLIVDLGSSYTVNRVMILWAQYTAAKDYHVQIGDSLTGPWTDMKIITGNQADGLKDIQNLSNHGRYVKLNMTSREDAAVTGNFGYSIKELGVYGTTYTPPAPSGGTGSTGGTTSSGSGQTVTPPTTTTGNSGDTGAVQVTPTTGDVPVVVSPGSGGQVTVPPQSTGGSTTSTNIPELGGNVVFGVPAKASVNDKDPMPSIVKTTVTTDNGTVIGTGTSTATVDTTKLPEGVQTIHLTAKDSTGAITKTEIVVNVKNIKGFWQSLWYKLTTPWRWMTTQLGF